MLFVVVVVAFVIIDHFMFLVTYAPVKMPKIIIFYLSAHSDARYKLYPHTFRVYLASIENNAFANDIFYILISDVVAENFL